MGFLEELYEMFVKCPPEETESIRSLNVTVVVTVVCSLDTCEAGTVEGDGYTDGGPSPGPRGRAH